MRVRGNLIHRQGDGFRATGLRKNETVALMERAATTGFQAANVLLERWGLAGEELWTVPMHGLIAAS